VLPKIAINPWIQVINNFFFYYFNPALAFLSLGGLILFWIVRRRLPHIKIIQRVFYMNLWGLIIQSFYLIVAHIWLWSLNSFTKILLPPYTSWKYALNYSLFRFAWGNCFTIVFALFVIWVMEKMNKKFDERFFYPEEKWLCALGIITNPWPRCFVFLILLLLTFLIIQTLNILREWKRNKKVKQERLSMLYLWLPISLLSFFISYAIVIYVPVLRDIII